MDREVIEHKLESLRRCLMRIEEKCPADPVLMQDPDLQDTLSINLTRAVQPCVDIGAHCISVLEVPAPDAMRQTSDMPATAGVISGELAPKLKKAAGSGNIAIHNYKQIDWTIVHAIARYHLSDFREFAQAVAPKVLV